MRSARLPFAGLLLSMAALCLPAAGQFGRQAPQTEIPPAMRQRVDIRAVNVLIGSAFRSLSVQTGVDIRVDRDVPGELRVDVLSKGDTLWETMQRLALASRLKVEVIGPRALMVRPLADFWVWYRGRNVGRVTEAYGGCRKCDYERKREWRFCPMCGERLN